MQNKIWLTVLASLVIAGCSTVDNSAQLPERVGDLPSREEQASVQAAHRPELRSQSTWHRGERQTSYDNLWARLVDGYALQDYSDHPRVQKEVAFYSQYNRHLQRLSMRAEPFMYLIMDEVEQRGLPMELALVPAIESGYNPFANSAANAGGMWQFMPQTARNFGLNLNNDYDGRRDILASTRAALNYLEYLGTMFNGDWLLAVAAYNAGEGRVMQAVKANESAGKPTDFFSLDLPQETTLHVPRLLAMAELVKNPERYGMPINPIPNEPYLTEISVGKPISLSIAAKMIDISEDELQLLNPAYNSGVTNAGGKHRLLVPTESADRMRIALALADAQKQPLVDQPQKPAATAVAATGGNYKVVSGDTLGHIAQRHGVSVDALRQANNLKSNNLRVGQSLLIPGAKGTNASGNTQVAQQKMEEYRVKDGDTLWDIGRAYGISHQTLAKANNLSVNANLKLGQRLQIPVQQKAGSIQSIRYQVKKGDSLYSIAKHFNVSIAQLTKWNDLDDDELMLRPGQTLLVQVTADKRSS